MKNQIAVFSDLVKPVDFDKKYALYAPYLLNISGTKQYFSPIIKTSNEFKNIKQLIAIPIININKFHNKINLDEIVEKFGFFSNKIFLMNNKFEYPKLIKINGLGIYEERINYEKIKINNQFEKQYQEILKAVNELF